MRILHLASSHRWTGAAEPAADLALAQMGMGHQVAFCCVKGESFWRKLEKMGLDPLDRLDLRPGFHPLASVADVLRLRRLIPERKIDVVHCHLPHDHWIAAAASNRFSRNSHRRGGPILVRTLHRDIAPRGDQLHRRLYNDATDLLITVSRAGRETLLERLGVDDGKAVWIRGAVDLTRFNPDIDRLANRRLWQIPDDAPVAGIVARMQPHRRHLDLIETIGDVLARIPGAYYIIAGRGELKRRIRQTVREHPHGNRLLRVGYRKHDLPETYAAMDVSVLLAQGSDGTCRAVLEAMACGRPVIGARIGAIADTIEAGKTGWLIDPSNRRELVSALVDALGNPIRTAEMGRAARRKVESEFTQKARAEKTLAAYEEALARRK